MPYCRYWFSIVLFFSFLTAGLAQNPFRIALINDDDRGFAATYEGIIKDEISGLLNSRTDVIFESYTIKSDIEATDLMIANIYVEEKADLVIGIGIVSSLYLAHREPYSVPTISSVVIDRELLNLPHTDTDGTGINNYTYIQTPFDVKKDLELFHKLFPYKNLGIMLDANVGQMGEFLNAYWRKRIPDSINFELVQYTGTLADKFEEIDGKYDALYLLSFPYESEENIREFYHKLNHAGIPTFSLTGREQVEFGAMAGLAPPNYITTLVRRLALDVMNIYEGTNASTLPTTIPTVGDDFVMNMQTLKHLDIYPDFDILNQAILLDLELSEGDATWSLESLIFEALKTNLGLAAAMQDVAISDEEVNIAKSNLRPQLNISSSATLIDPNRVANSNGQAADFSWLANATLNQVIYNEPAMANIAIQKLLNQSQHEVLRQNELDIILEAATAFLSYLQAKSIVKIQNENVDVTNQNLNISESKEALGYSGISDVYRLRTQLSQNTIDLNNSISNLNRTRININRIINRDQTEEFNVVDLEADGSFSLGGNPALANLIKNQRDLDRLTDFFVERAFEYLPELRQIDYSLQAQERSLLSNKRSLYMPKLNLQGSADQPIEYRGAATPPQGFPGLEKDLQWSLGAQVSLPIFQGGLRKANTEKDKISVAQIKNQQQDFRNSLEAQLRSNMQILSASYQQLQLSQEAADYSNKNFEIIQDLYRQGQVDIITLVDAQNASLSAELSANNALYQLMVDFLTVERSTGNFFFLMSDSEKTDFIQKIMSAVFK